MTVFSMSVSLFCTQMMVYIKIFDTIWQLTSYKVYTLLCCWDFINFKWPPMSLMQEPQYLPHCLLRDVIKWHISYKLPGAQPVTLKECVGSSLFPLHAEHFEGIGHGWLRKLDWTPLLLQEIMVHYSWRDIFRKQEFQTILIFFVFIVSCHLH